MAAHTWHLLIHRLPARPLYFRARVRNALQRLGAVTLKKSVYALPAVEGTLDPLRALVKSIRDEGGEAFLCEATFPDPADEAVLTRALRDRVHEEYRAVEHDARRVHAGTSPDAARHAPRLRGRLAWAAALDVVAAPGRREAEAALRVIEVIGRGGARPPAGRFVGRTWVTRAGISVDRIACAWLVRRFLDPGARFRFVSARTPPLAPGETGFDMPGGEFTHVNGKCSFEALLAASGRTDPALRRIAGIVHDLDLRDDAFGYPEAAGVGQVLAGILAAHDDDETRLERGAALFDDLLRSLTPRPRVTAPAAAKAMRRGPRGRTS